MVDMQPRMSYTESQDTLALAHALYCHCSELSGPYEIASRNLKALHNTLEEIFETLDHATASREAAALEKAVGECSRVLNAIDRALEYQDRQPLSNNKTTVKFTARIELATQKLLKAYDGLKKDTGERASASNSPISPYHSQLASKSSCELDGATNTVSSLQFYDFKYGTAMATPSLDVHRTGRSVPVVAKKIPMDYGLKDLARLSPIACDSWKLPFAFADPMSSDIETASYLILAGDTANTITSDTPATSPKQSQESGHITDNDYQAQTEATTAHPEINSSASQPVSRESKSQYRVVNADPPEREEESYDTASEYGGVSRICESRTPIIPEKNSRRTLRRGSTVMAQKRMARVFSRVCDDAIYLEGEHSALMQNNFQAQSNSSVNHLPSSSGPDSDVDAELEALIIRSFNDGDFHQAGLHLESLLVCRPRPFSLDYERRTRHLLGVIASLKGMWEQALCHFVSVLSTPLLNITRVEASDCAAAYWMGDIYALFNRKAEALIAYSIAEQGLARRYPDRTDSHQQLVSRIRAEQKICQGGNDRLSFELELDKKMHCELASADSILNSDIMSRDIAHTFLELVQWSSDNTHPARPNQSRAMALSEIEPKSAQWLDMHNLQLRTFAFSSSAPWPMPFDPLFASANIACGLSLSPESDLLHLKNIPRTSGTLSRRRMNCFTCQDLHWLIKTLRACMQRLELKSTEIANPTGIWVIPQYSSTEGLIASTHFISISIFRLTFRSGYGVEICPGGIFSSRITENSEEKGDEKSGQAHELKRIKKLILGYLDAALRREEAREEQNIVIPVMSISGVTSIHRGSSWKGKRPESGTLSSPATSRRSESSVK